MSITLHWQHTILLAAFLLPIILFWFPYAGSDSDTYGIGGLFVAAVTLIVWLIGLVIYFGLYYFGVVA